MILSRRNLCLLLAIVFPLSALIPWICLDHSLPASDAAQFFEASFKVFQLWSKQGFWAALPAFYLLRGWKPVLLLPIGAINLIFAGGDVLWAIRFGNIEFYTLFLVFSFLTFEIFMDPVESAFATGLVGVLPWCLFSAHYFGLEIPVLACTVAAFYWLVRSWDFSSVRAARWMGFFLGLGLCFRPPDVLLFFFCPVALWIWSGLRTQKLKLIDGPVWLVGVSPFLLLFFLPQQSSPLLVLSLLCLPATAIYIFRSRLKLNSVFAQAVFVSYLIMALWYAPFLDQLRSWIFEAGFSPAAAHAHADLAGFELLERFLMWLCGAPMVPLLVAAGIGYWGETKAGFVSKKWIYALVASAGFSLVAGAFSHDVVIRNHYPAAVLLFGGISWMALSPKPFGKQFRWLLVCSTVGLCWVWNFYTIYLPGDAPRLLPNDPTKEYFYPFTPQEHDPSTRTLDFLAAHLPHRALKVTIFPLFPPEMMSYFQVPEYLSVGSQQRGYEWSFAMTDKPGPSTDLVLVIVDPQNDARFGAMVAGALPDWTVESEIPWTLENQRSQVILRVLKRRK